MASFGIRTLCVCLLLVSACCGDSWQSYGNFTQDNLTLIRSTLDAVIPSIDTTSTSTLSLTTSAAAKNISDTLNKVWDFCWNIMIIQHTKGVGVVKSVFYGYAFRNHWLWYDDYTAQLSIIIWKDYNSNFNLSNFVASNTMISSFKNTITTKANEVVTANPNLYDDPWEFGHQLIEKMDAISSSQAFSVIVADSVVNFYGYGCVKPLPLNTYYYKDFTLTSGAGKQLFFIIFRMR